MTLSADQYSKVRQAITAYLDANWTPPPAIIYANTPGEPNVGTAWIRPFVMTADVERNTITGSPDTGQKLDGILEIQVFSPNDEGTGANETIIDTLRALFNELTVPITGGNPISFYRPRPIEIGNSVQGGAGARPGGESWYQVNLQCPFDHVSQP